MQIAAHDSLWWAEPDPPAYPPLAESLDTEVAIVGGGITGVTLAWSLAEQGAQVALLEADRVASGASGRNAGFLLAAPAEPYQEQIALWGRAGARAVLDTGRRTHQRLRALVEQLGIECEYRPRGSIRLSTSDEEAEDTRASLAPMRADGFPMEEVPLSAALPEHARGGFVAAFHTAEDGELHPVRFVRAVARAAAARGVRVFERSPVRGARWQAGWEVQAGGGVVRARTLVIASNAWAAELCPALASLVVPRRGQMLATAPLDVPVAPLPTYAHWGYRYWRQTPDGRLVIGGWRDLDPDAETGDEARTTPAIQAGIESGLRALLPGGALIEHRWAGIMGFARDGRPLVGWLDADHHLAVCAGFTGHGMGMAAACTHDLAALLAWKPAPGIATFDPLRYPELRQAPAGLTVPEAGAA